MRSKFSDLVAAGVASFHPSVNAPDEPSGCEVCRTYNNIWGFITDTCCRETSEGLVITGSFFSHPDQLDDFLFSPSWKNVTFRSAGYICLSDFLSHYNLCGKLITFNGSPALKLVDCEKCEGGYIGKSCTTSASRIPQPVGQFLPTASEVTPEVVESMNSNPHQVGTGWHLYEGRLVGQVNDKNIIIPIVK